ncbi:hypothetical protein Lalb_Chr17g0337771 [Lupinus albus]|uniref:Uncharacterized protein n=1 Tax=Lupinus albus TaxID=3870 RepID=A0A6A4P168_LUPAL|nr:hypothetical protein Lalb_Chr17g0337771 [Lupinus albus]
MLFISITLYWVLGEGFLLASTTALLSKESLGGSIENFHNDLAPYLKSRTESGRVAFAGVLGDCS